MVKIPRKLPGQIRVDNGPEFISQVFKESCESKQIEIKYIQPGKPVQNALIERFNRWYREDVLDAYIFNELEQVKIISEKWNEDYNENHPHGSLEELSPGQYTIAGKNMKVLRVVGTNAPFELSKEEDLTLRIFIDKNIIEVFANDKQAVVVHHNHIRKNPNIKIFSKDADLNIEEINAWKIKSIYEGETEFHSVRK